MSKLVVTLALASSILFGVGGAFAGTPGNALKDQSNAGFITPHGVFDGR